MVSEFSFHHHGKGRVEPSSSQHCSQEAEQEKREAQDKIQYPEIYPFMMGFLQLGISSSTSQKNIIS